MLLIVGLLAIASVSLVIGVPAVAFSHAVAGDAVAGVTVADVPAVAGLPAIAGVPAVAGLPAVAGVPAVADILFCCGTPCTLSVSIDSWYHKGLIYTEYHSVCVCLRNWDSPTPSPASECAPSPRTKGWVACG